MLEKGTRQVGTVVFVILGYAFSQFHRIPYDSRLASFLKLGLLRWHWNCSGRPENVVLEGSA